MITPSFVVGLVTALTLAQSPEVEASQSAPSSSGGLFKDFHGTILVDTFGSAHVQSADATSARVFDTAGRSFALSYAKLGVWFDANPVGFRVDLGVGQTIDVLSSDTTTPVLRNFEQAYVSAKLPFFQGLTIDFGRYLTCAGNETVDSRDSWTYSRSLLFGYAAPFTHTGFRATAQLTEKWSVLAGVNQGWDVILDNNSSKSVFGGVAFDGQQGTQVALSGFAGRELPDDTAPWRYLLDGVWKQKLPRNFEAALNFDAAVEGQTAWYGAAVTGHYAWRMLDVAVRGEVFNDPQNSRLRLPQMTGGAWAWEATVSARATLTSFAQVRAEYRHDQFTGSTSQAQDTVTLAVVAGL